MSVGLLTPFARRLTGSIRLSIVKPFKGGLRVRHWSQILTPRGRRSTGGTHLHVISTRQILLEESPVVVALLCFFFFGGVGGWGLCDVTRQQAPVISYMQRTASPHLSSELQRPFKSTVWGKVMGAKGVVLYDDAVLKSEFVWSEEKRHSQSHSCKSFDGRLQLECDHCTTTHSRGRKVNYWSVSRRASYLDAHKAGNTIFATL